MVYMPFFINKREDRVLPYRAWHPFTLDNVNYYYIAYLHAAWGVTITALVNGASETGVPAIMMQVCAQFSLLEERFRKLPLIIQDLRKNSKPESEIRKIEKDYMVRCINHHLKIYE